ncbi:Membrane-bound transcription factor site-2 protease [Dissophora ornata]|nr:Membrane-bound transcription factor site-2 protease [Dissophora ornata]
MVRLYCATPSWATKSTATTDRKVGADQRVGSTVEEEVVLYQGDPKDIWEAVQVTTMGSRWSFLPLWLPNAILLTIRYTMSFSLALSVLNIVPARHLDGHHALKAFVALVFSIQQSYKSTQSVRESLAECLLEGGSATSGGGGLSSSVSTATFTKGNKVVKGIVISTTVLLGGVMVGSLLQMIATFVMK